MLSYVTRSSRQSTVRCYGRRFTRDARFTALSRSGFKVYRIRRGAQPHARRRPAASAQATATDWLAFCLQRRVRRLASPTSHTRRVSVRMRDIASLKLLSTTCLRHASQRTIQHLWTLLRESWSWPDTQAPSPPHNCWRRGQFTTAWRKATQLGYASACLTRVVPSPQA